MRGTKHVWDDPVRGAFDGQFRVRVTFPDGKEEEHTLYCFNRQDAVNLIDEYNRRDRDTIYRLIS